MSSRYDETHQQAFDHLLQLAIGNTRRVGFEEAKRAYAKYLVKMYFRLFLCLIFVVAALQVLGLHTTSGVVFLAFLLRVAVEVQDLRKIEKIVAVGL